VFSLKQSPDESPSAKVREPDSPLAHSLRQRVQGHVPDVPTGGVEHRGEFPHVVSLTRQPFSSGSPSRRYISASTSKPKTGSTSPLPPMVNTSNPLVCSLTISQNAPRAKLLLNLCLALLSRRPHATNSCRSL
jgi:hypothetical protein